MTGGGEPNVTSQTLPAKQPRCWYLNLLICRKTTLPRHFLQQTTRRQLCRLAQTTPGQPRDTSQTLPTDNSAASQTIVLGLLQNVKFLWTRDIFLLSPDSRRQLLGASGQPRRQQYSSFSARVLVLLQRELGLLKAQTTADNRSQPSPPPKSTIWRPSTRARTPNC